MRRDIIIMRLTFGQGGALDLSDLDGECPGEGGAGRDHGEHHGVVAGEPHVHVH